MLKFLVDESCGRNLFLFIREKGFDVKYIGDIMPRADDLQVLAFAEDENRILITNDKDFGELIFRIGRPSSGVILLRLRSDMPAYKQKYISYILDNFSNKLKSHFIVVKESGVRIRKL